MLGSILGGAAKGLMKKPKKINPDKFAGKMEETKESSKSKGGALALAPSESIVKVVDIKPNEPKVKVKGGPLAEIQEGVHSIVAALSNESKAKKKRLKGLFTIFFYFRSELIFWIVMGCGIADFGRRALKTS